jgi:pentatricopeptide repeat protein
MPTTLPVPSKGALRTLRNLALGTSCTVVFSAGLLTEDRRRRIHTAREVHSNAQKLKSSRKYHSTGTATLESFEEQAIRYREDAFWLPSNVARAKDFVAPNLPANSESSRKTTLPQSSSSKSLGNRSSEPGSLKTPWRPIGGRAPGLPRVPTAAAAISLKPLKQKIHNRQHKLAVDVERLLKGGEEPPNIDAAASRFFDVFEEGLQVGDTGLMPILVDAAIKLSDAGFEQSKLGISERVLIIISRNGPIDEAQFQKFKPAIIMNRLITGPTQMDPGKPYVDDEKLKAAASIYLTTFKTKPKTVASEQMQSLGERLCAATCHAGMYDLTLKLYARLERQRGKGHPRAINYLIIAAHAKGQHTKIFRYFKNFYTQTSPDQLQFYNVGDLVIDSVLKGNDTKKAEEVLVDATKMAESGGILISTTWLLKVLGHDWRTNRDIARTRAVFERMVPQLKFTKHPQAVYGAIIQFCIEADQESVAMAYYDQLAESYETLSSDVRILGHLAFAKALRNDWDGVKEDLRNISGRNPNRRDEYSAIFTPILKAFVRSHHVDETEKFIRIFIEESQLRITTSMFNIMIGVYCKSKELDAMARWIDYATSVGCRVDAVTINTILSNCFSTYKYSFGEIFQLYQMICGLDRGRVVKFTSGHTVSILRGIAVSSASSDDEARKNLSRLKKLEIVPPGPDSRGIYRKMLQAYAKECPVDVLRLYKCAQADNITLDAKHLLVAVKASLKLHGRNLDESASLIKSAQMNGQEVCAPMARLIVHQMESLDEGGTDADQISKMARDAIISLERRGVKVPSTVTTHALSVLVRRGRYQSAIDLWESMSHHFKRPSSSVDLHTLTVLLKAYIGLQEQRGIEWVIRMLSINNLIPDKRFHLLLKTTRKEARKLTKTQTCTSKVHGFLGAIIAASKQVVEMRGGLEEEKKDVQFRTIKIIEKALEDQAVRDGTTAPTPAEIAGVSKERERDVAMGRVYAREPPGTWTESEEPGYEFNLPPERLVGVGAA